MLAPAWPLSLKDPDIVRSIQIKGSRKSGRKVIIYLVNGAIKRIHQLLTARPHSILQHNVKMTVWSKSCLPSFPTSVRVHRVDLETRERAGGCGVFELSTVKAVTVFTFKSDEIKRLKLEKLKGRSASLCSVWAAFRYLRCVLLWSAVARHTFPSLLPLVPLKHNRLSFKNTVL